MYWNKKKLKYDILIPPLSKPLDMLSLEEATNYFEWYINSIPTRIEYLKRISNLQLDLSPESLIPLWSWFLKQAEIENTPKAKLEELNSQIKAIPYDIASTVLEENKTQFSLQTEYILRDIAMYFGEVCVKNNQAIYWGFHTDAGKDSFANRPILMGFLDRDFSPPFQAEFDPTFTVRCIACNLFDGDASKQDLKRMYDKWKRMM